VDSNHSSLFRLQSNSDGDIFVLGSGFTEGLQARSESINGEVDVYIIAPPSRLAGVAVNEINAF
jgi:hypothetical protein